MKKLDNFSNCLRVLEGADFALAEGNEIYRMGVIGQFNLTFEMAWKALQAVLRAHGAQGAETGSPREILQLGYKLGFVDDAAVWLAMLKARNVSAHIYDEEKAGELVRHIGERFIPAFAALEKTLREKCAEVEDDWQ
ncbi:MAG: HI0074 family nucleotidyltransferase substrate-binding subunit [Peptococcaceae bacterium]|nr:HI0074 family nucleotidyltransferase substrate-binding subunit [Peptococcaceae bacterium]